MFLDARESSLYLGRTRPAEETHVGSKVGGAVRGGDTRFLDRGFR
jgi:hypothetical protein